MSQPVTCNACKTEVPPGRELGGVGDYTLCADLEECTDRMVATGQAQEKAGSSA